MVVLMWMVDRLQANSNSVRMLVLMPVPMLYASPRCALLRHLDDGGCTLSSVADVAEGGEIPVVDDGVRQALLGHSNLTSELLDGQTGCPTRTNLDEEAGR